MRPGPWRVGGCLLLLLGGALTARAVETAASGPVRVSMSLYDRGFGLVTEMRRVTLAAGENVVRFTQLPSKLDPTSISFMPLAGPMGLEVQEQRFAYDLAGADRLFERYQGAVIRVEEGGYSREGRLLAAPGLGEGDVPLSLGMDDGSVITFLRPEHVDQVVFPDAATKAFLEPTLVWHAVAAQEGPQNLRLSYSVPGLTWEAHYECVLGEKGQAFLGGRVTIANESGGAFDNARVKLVVTEKGAVPPILPAAGRAGTGPATAALRYAYGGAEPTFERQAASAGTVATYTLPRPLTIGVGETRNLQLFAVNALPVRRFYVYDGVRFDRFQRNRRNDWNYGTEFHRTVETHIEFDNNEHNGLGMSLPPGMFRLYEKGEDQAVDLVGEDRFTGAKPDTTGHLLLGPARGLEGERERTGYSEVTPLHEYEESFEIRLANFSEEEVEIRVVEHLYRWPRYEIVRADTEYEESAPQVIEFRPLVKPGGKRSVHYTVRYSW